MAQKKKPAKSRGGRTSRATQIARLEQQIAAVEDGSYVAELREALRRLRYDEALGVAGPSFGSVAAVETWIEMAVLGTAAQRRHLREVLITRARLSAEAAELLVPEPNEEAGSLREEFSGSEKGESDDRAAPNTDWPEARKPPNRESPQAPIAPVQAIEADDEFFDDPEQLSRPDEVSDQLTWIDEEDAADDEANALVREWVR